MTRKNPKPNVTSDIINKIHLLLANARTGQELLEFLKSTEPAFMAEVSRFINAELNRLRFTIPDSQALYIGSIIGAAYIAGFLIAREADHKIYNGLIDFDSPIKKVLNSDEIDKLIDRYRDEGKNFKEIGKEIQKHFNIKKPVNKKDTKKKNKIDIDELGL